MADVPFATNLLPAYQSPQQMQIQGAQAQNLTADAALTNTQNQGAQLANQKAGLQLGLLQDYLSSASASPPTSDSSGAAQSGSPTIGATGINPDDVTGYAISKFAPLPTARPPAVIAQMTKANLAGLPEVAANIGAQYDAQVAGANQQRALGANAAYQTAQQVADAPDGAAFETLNRYNPEAAAAIKAKYPGDSPSQLDADVRAYAQHIGIATHQYAGRDAEFQNGVLVDKKDGKPVLGSEQVLTGLSAADKQKAFAEANEPVTVGDQLPVPRYQAAGFHSAEAYVIAADRAARSSSASPGPAGLSGGAGLPPAISRAVAPNAAQTAGNSAQTTAQTANLDPALKQALADPSYRYQPPKIPPATSQAELEANKATAQEAAKNYQTNSNSLKTSSDEVTSASSKALQYFNAAKTILAQPDSKWAAGVPGDVNAMLSKLGINTDAGTTRAEVVKNLTQAALQGLKTTYGSKPAMFDVKVNLEQAFPDIKGDQGLPAVKNLIDENIRNLTYDVATGRRVLPYLKAGNDPAQFNTWNEQNFQRSANVNAGGSRAPAQASAPSAAQEGAKSVSKSGKPIIFTNGHWQYQ